MPITRAIKRDTLVADGDYLRLHYGAVPATTRPVAIAVFDDNDSPLWHNVITP